jgi:integrase
MTTGVRQVTRDGKKTKKWIAQVRIKGSPATSKVFDSKLEAEKWRIMQLELCNKGAKPQGRKTLIEALERYAIEITPEKKGARWDLLRIAKFKELSFATLPLTEITTNDVQEWINSRKRVVQGSTIRREMNLLSSVFGVCIKQWQWCEINPTSNTRKPPKPAHRDRTITSHEKQALLDALGYDGVSSPATQQQHIGWALLFALETAMRQGEMWASNFADIDMAKKHLTLHETKNGTSRKVPLSPNALRLLELLPRTQGRIIPYNQASCGQIYRAAVKLCNITDLTFHDLRHSAITSLAAQLQPLELARMVGHKNLNQLLTYYNESATAIAERLK